MAKIAELINEGLKQIDHAFAPLINGVSFQIGKLEAAKQDPSNYFDLDENQFVNYFQIRDTYLDAKSDAVNKFKADMAAKEAELKESEEGSEEESDALKIIYELAYYAVTSIAENGLKIKIGDVEWDSSKPLGGKGSMFDDLRRGFLNSFGIDPDSEIGRIISDPINAAGELPENTKAAIDKALTDAKREADVAAKNVKREVDKFATDVKKATDKALTDAKREVDRAATNIARELGKVLKPKIRIRVKPIKIKW